MRIARQIISSIALSCIAHSAAAQTANEPALKELPDPATIKVPSLTVEGAGKEEKYAYFHKEGVSFPVAFADLRECYSYANAPIPAIMLPAHVEVTTAPPAQLARTPISFLPYGLVGMGIGALVAPGVDRRLHQANMRMCMGFKAYKRYPVSKQAYISMTEGDARQAILMQAKIASGPTPATEALQP